jgi:hypothetical protein
MRHRIAIWAITGFFVVCSWQLYVIATAPIPINSQAILWTLLQLTCPIVFAGFNFHFGVRIYWVLLANAATYTLVGLIVEILWQQLHDCQSAQE